MTVEQLGWAQRDVISVAPEVAAIDAMRKMHQAAIGAVAVVSASGKLIGNFSVSELRYACWPVERCCDLVLADTSITSAPLTALLYERATW